MASNKKYYWLKLKEDFFEEKQIKYLRKLPDGDKLVIAYLKMQLKSLRTEGFIKYDSILPSNEDELAMILDEDSNIVKLMVQALLQVKAIEILDDGSFYMIAMQDLIGKEGQSAERVRNFRERQKQVALQCNTDVTKCNTEIEKEKEKEIDKDINNIYIVEQSTTPPKLSSNCNEIIKYLNQKIGTNYKCTTKKTQTLIRARINEGFIEEDFKKVIDNKCEEWLGTEWEKFLRPETLFGTKFESYLNTKVQKKGESYNGRDKQNNSKYSEIDLSANLAKSTTDEEIDDSGLI